MVQKEIPKKYFENKCFSMSFGQKILERYGFKQGDGLGKNSNGITEPIKANFKVRQLRAWKFVYFPDFILVRQHGLGRQRPGERGSLVGARVQRSFEQRGCAKIGERQHRCQPSRSRRRRDHKQKLFAEEAEKIQHELAVRKLLEICNSVS